MDNDKIVYLPLDNGWAEAGDRRPWISCALMDLAVKEIFISAKAEKREGREDDDIKLAINGEVQKNIDEKAHDNWYWCGKVLAGKELEFKKEVKLEKGTHYIELWADEQPMLKRIEITIKEDKKPETKTDDSKRIPTVDDPEWTGDYNDDTEQMILARAIWGEARSTSKEARTAVAWSIKNRLKARETWDTYHHIILDPDQYSAFWEKPPKDPNLIALRDPLGTTENPADHKKWRETYALAGRVMEGDIADPTDGATHYYDDSIEPPYWAKNIKLKIENLNFFYSK